jgi:hypothetical protein
MSKLNDYEGQDVLQASIRVINAGDGLSQAMLVGPAELHHGERVYVVLETEVARVSYDPLGDTGCLKRVHTLRAGTGTIVDAELVAEVLEQQRIAIEQAQGVERLDLDGNGE